MSNKRVQAINFAFKEGYRAQVPASVAGQELARIHERDGVVTAAAVVDEARPEDAALHPAFEWRDEVAAEHYRKHQARSLIKAVTVVREHSDEVVEQPVYIHVPVAASETTGPGYHQTEVVTQRPDLYAAALGALQKNLQQANESVMQLQRAVQLVDSLDDGERLTHIGLAAQALQTANAAVQALH